MRQARQRNGLLKTTKRQANGSACIDTAPGAFAAPKKNIWSGLTDQEAASVTKWLFQQKDLNLTTTDKAGEWDNTILLVELMIPNKSDVLSFIDGYNKPPTRFAHVVLDHRASVDPYYADTLVGPLPVRNGTTHWEPLTFPYTKENSGRVRNLNADEDVTLYESWLYPISRSILDITLGLWGGSALGLDNGDQPSIHQTSVTTYIG